MKQLKSNHIRFRLILLLLMFIIFFTHCSKREKDELAYPLKTAKMISQVTVGLISSQDAIRVRFVAEMVEENLVGVVMQKQVFEFEPSIDGITEWEDRRTLKFSPNGKLPLRAEYEGKLDLAVLFPEHKDADLQPLQIQFSVAGREINTISADFELVNPNDPSRLLYKGEVLFTEEIDIDAVNRASSLAIDKRNIKLSWSRGSGNSHFRFESELVERDTKEKTLFFKLNKVPLGISQDYEKEAKLFPLSNLTVIDFGKVDLGQQPAIEVKFSDELDPNQDITGLITFDPPMESKLSKSGQTITIRGNFNYGESYTLVVHAGIRSKWGTTIISQLTNTLEFEDLKPGMKFSSDGVFLPTVNNRTLRFQTLNLRTVHVEIKKVFESNLGQFLQSEKLGGRSDRNESFNDYYVERVGVIVANDTLEIGETKNIWLQHELDLQQLIKPDENGLHLIKLSFDKNSMVYNMDDQSTPTRRRRYFGENYYTNPNSQGYLYRYGQIYKPIIISDIGLTYKQGHEQQIVYASNIKDATPLSGVLVNLRTYQNQIMQSETTDGQGRAIFDVPAKDIFYVEAEKDGQHSLIKLNEMSWNLSTFDTGGETIQPGATRAFIYSDRGVYRPGDTIYLSVIARNDDDTFPENHPVTLKVYNPKNQMVYEQINRESKDGFYSFRIETHPADLTGNWRAQVTAGMSKFNYPLKVETVVPFRLKVNIDPVKDRLAWNDKALNLIVKSTYLFGNPASNLEAEVEVNLNASTKRFSKYRKFQFSNRQIEFKPIKQNIFKGKLNSDGESSVSWTLPDLSYSPSAINAIVKATVFEKGGRPNFNFKDIPIDPFEYYVGIQIPEFDYGYTRVGALMDVPIILVDPGGNPVSGRNLHYRIYKNTSYWWWEYGSHSDFRFRFKSDTHTKLLTEDDLISQHNSVHLQFTPEDRGEYLVEVTDGLNGHTAAFFFSAYHWGSAPASVDNAGELVLKSDKNKYAPGDIASVSFPTPKEGRILVSIEKSSSILDSYWQNPNPEDFETTLEIPVTAEMLPNVYVSVSIIQPQSQTENDRPIRMYGVVPLLVEEESTRETLIINMVESLKPKELFDIDISTFDESQTQFTIAVVDEGLLDLTHFQTPDPWQLFFAKQSLNVNSYDLYSYIIGINKGDVFKVFSIGGDLAARYRTSQMDDEKAKRFEPVALFKGPLSTDENGKASVQFEMPDYIGSVRVMVISAKGSKYGHADQTVPVKTDLMVLPSLPRSLGVGDQIVVPVTVFAMRDSIGTVNVSLNTEGPVTIIGVSSKAILLNERGEKDLFFDLSANMTTGIATINISVEGQNIRSEFQTELDIRTSSPRLYESAEKEVARGRTVSFIIPDKGIPGSNHASISIRRRPKMNFANRLQWLIRYPYGCIEQSISAVFPQLYLKTILAQTLTEKDEIDLNINEGIKRLRRFQLPSGGFTYWPGSTSPSSWGTNYAGHFLIEAKNLGYSVPAGLMKNWLRYQKSQALVTRDNLMTRVYGVYLLALADEPAIGPMNLLKENNLKDMRDVEKWLLASAYKMAGIDRTATQILRETGKSVSDYNEFGGTYGSGWRDRAIILDQLINFQRMDEADELAQQIASVLSARDWYSTQTTGFMLLALGKYLYTIEGEGSDIPTMTGEFRLPNGETIDFDTQNFEFSHTITRGFGNQVEVRLNDNATITRAFVTLSWDGVPLISEARDESKNLGLQVTWLDEDGMKIDPKALQQGSSFWAHYEVANPNKVSIEELALVQLLPAGWEVDNIRLTGETMPNWMSNWNLNYEEYLDIRDDRVMWFFDFPRNIRSRNRRNRRNRNQTREVLDFVLKLNAVTTGQFVLPPTTVEAMYNNQYKGLQAGYKVEVMAR